MKKHDINMIAQWAKDWGIDGFDHLDPKVREQRRVANMKKQRERTRKDEERRFSSQK